jgi:ribosomal protein L12E/L44/L45/RPP1/RPP2
MSKKPADKSIDEQTFEALEDALKIDLNDDGLGVLDDVSLDELEDKVSNAAKELKSAGAAQRPSAQSAKTAPGENTAPKTAYPAFTPCRPDGAGQ